MFKALKWKYVFSHGGRRGGEGRGLGGGLLHVCTGGKKSHNTHICLTHLHLISCDCGCDTLWQSFNLLNSLCLSSSLVCLQGSCLPTKKQNLNFILMSLCTMYTPLTVWRSYAHRGNFIHLNKNTVTHVDRSAGFSSILLIQEQFHNSLTDSGTTSTLPPLWQSNYCRAPLSYKTLVGLLSVGAAGFVDFWFASTASYITVISVFTLFLWWLQCLRMLEE